MKHFTGQTFWLQLKLTVCASINASLRAKCRACVVVLMHTSAHSAQTAKRTNDDRQRKTALKHLPSGEGSYGLRDSIT